MDMFFLQNETNYTSNKKVSDLKPGDKNVDIQVIILSMVFKNKLKNDSKLTQFLVADHSGSVLCNFFDETGDMLNEGDIIFMKSCYASIFKNKMVVYSSRPGYGYVVKLSSFFMTFSESPNMSDKLWKMVKDDKTGADYYIPDESA